MAISKAFDSRNQNIDNMIDALISIQKEHGIQPSMREALFDPNTKERINRFQRAKLEKEGVDLSKYNLHCNGNCSSCKKEDTHTSNIERGVFVYSENDLVDEEDGDYVCEFCTKIGYDGKYRPEVCDTCDDCDGCTDAIAGECDGCRYSAYYNGGITYGVSTQQDENQFLSPEDSQIIEDLREEKPEEQIRYPDGGFSIMDY